jgi:hypothetical protein
MQNKITSKELYMKLFILIFAAILSVFTLKAQAPYCTPSTSNGCGFGDQITDVFTTGGITNISDLNSTCSPGNYAYDPSQPLTIPVGGSFDISTKSGPTFSQGIAIWIDWNNDFDFTDAGEHMWTSTSWSTTLNTVTLTAPTAQATGTYRMRLRCSYNSLPTDPCANQTYGEVQEYDVVVVQGNEVINVCNGDVPPPFNNVDSVSGGSGNYGYIWQSSVDYGLNWTSATGINDSISYVPLTSHLDTTFYRRVVIDQSCGHSAYSNIIEVRVPDTLKAVTMPNAVSCNGLADGSLVTTVSGGFAPFSYLWSNGDTTSTLSGLSASTYTLTLTDDNGCTAISSTIITEPAALIATITLDSNDIGNGGGATGSATGGTTAYTYTWSNGATTASITGASAGTYSITITDQNGCTDSASVLITAGPLTSIILDSNVSCNGLIDGGATASAVGGTTPYTYTWSNSATTASITGVVAGTYSVTITDQSGLTDSSSVTITEPAILASASVIDSNVSCNNGFDGGATASATGGTMPYTYTWSNSATTASITGVGAGTFSVTITDQNGCTDSTSTSITEPTALVASTALDSNVSCNSGFDGGVTASVTGGTMPYTYTWSNAATTASITGVMAGTYSITITDQNGCTDSASVTITEPTLLAASSIADSNVSCNGFSNGGATASATGGTGTYTYAWSNAATTASITGVMAGTYTVTLTDANGCTSSSSTTITEPVVLVSASVVDSNVSCNAQTDGGATASATGGTMPYTYAWSNAATTASITGVMAGTYSVTITDANGCTDSTSLSITEPAALISAGVVDSNVSCNTGSDGGATGSATGGTMPYTYTWSNAATTSSITGVMAGTYSVTITDQNGCTDSSSVMITEPTALVSSSMVDSTLTCNGLSDGGATASATGGTGVYTYTWSNAATTASITGVVAGTYSVTITDANGCTDSSSAIITEPAVLVAVMSIDSNESCVGLANGQASASATGGTMPYTYAWSTGATADTLTGLSASTYTVTITDANGCTSTTTDSVIVSDVIAPTVITQNITVYLDSAGNVSITASAIDNGSTDNCTIDSLSIDVSSFSCSEVGANTVILTVNDLNGNSDTASAVVTVMDTIAPEVITQSVTVFLDATGAASITTTEINAGSNDACGVSTIMLDSTSFDCVETGANTVTLTVTDVNGNSNTATATVTVLDTIAPVAIAQNVTVYLDANGTASITTSDIDNSSSDNCSIATLALDSTSFDCGEVGANTVILTVTDASGNTDTASATVTVMDTIAPTVITQNVIVYLDVNGEATITTTMIDNGSFDNCSIATISLDSTNFDCSEEGDNVVTLTIIDANGNTNSATAVVTVSDTISPTVITQNVTVYLDANGAASISTADIDNNSFDNCGVATLSLDSTNFDCSEVGANTVTLTVTDVNANANTATATVTVLDTISPTVITQNITLYLDSNGEASTDETAIDNGSFDNCGIATITLDSTNFDCGETGANTVTLTITDDNGNVNTGTATITVLDTIAPELIVANDTAVCATDGNGTLVNFTNSANDNCGANAIVQTAGLADGSVFPIGITTNMFEVTDASGNITTDSFTIEVYAFPVLAIDAVDLLCETADAVALTAVPTAGVFSGTGVSGSSFDPTQAIPGNTEITYTYTTPESCVYSTSIFATVRENPVVTLGALPDTICVELEVVACPVATPAGGIYSGNGVDSILFYTNVAGIGEHWINYFFEDEYGCSSEDSTLANVVRCIDPFGIEETEAVLAPRVFPNPNRGSFTIQHSYNTEVSMSIYNMDGSLVRQIPALTNMQEITLEQKTQGIYFLQITGDGVNETMRIIVQ